MKLRLLALACPLLFAGAAHALPFAVDGNLTGDWNVTVADPANTSTSTPGSNFSGIASVSGVVSYQIEDVNDNASHGTYIGPLYGGQDYDVEFLAVGVSGNNLYLAISTGVRPDNGFSFYGPGDIRIQANNGHTYGIETGGGTGGGSFGGSGTINTLLNQNVSGTTYTLNSSGETQTVSAAAAAQKAGTIWKDPNWIPSALANRSFPSAPSPTQPAGTTENQLGFFWANTQFNISNGAQQAGSADYINTLNTFTSRHAVMELGISNFHQVFAGATSLDIYWGPACGNDTLVTVNFVPLPGTAALMLLGLAGLGFNSAARRHA